MAADGTLRCHQTWLAGKYEKNQFRFSLQHFMANMFLFFYIAMFGKEGILPMPFHGISWNYHWSYQWCHQPSHKASVDSWGNSKLSNQLGPDQGNMDKVIGLIPYQ